MLSASVRQPRRLNDVFFAVHASLAGAVMLGQIAFYDKGSQTVSATCKRVMAALAVGLALAMAVSLWPAVPWEPLDFFYLLGYIKARITTSVQGQARICECSQQLCAPAQRCTGFSAGYHYCDQVYASGTKVADAAGLKGCSHVHLN